MAANKKIDPYKASEEELDQFLEDHSANLGATFGDVVQGDPKAAPRPEGAPNPAGVMALEGMSPLQRGVAGAGAQFSDIGKGLGQGAWQLGNVVTGGNLFPEQLEQFTQDWNEERDLTGALRQDPYGRGGMLATDLGLGLTLPLTKAATGVATIPRAVMAGGLYGFAQPADELGKRGLQTLEGGAYGGLGLLAMRAGAKGVNTLRGRTDPAYLKQVDDYARGQGLDLTIGDLAGQYSPARGAEHFSEWLPFTARRKQLGEQAAALRDILLKPGTRPGETVNVIADDIRGVLQTRRTANEALWSDLGQKLTQVPHAAKGVDASLTQAGLKDVIRRFKTVLSKVEDKDLRDDIIQFANAPSSSISFNRMRDIQSKLFKLKSDANDIYARTREGKDLSRALDNLYSKTHDDMTAWGTKLSKAGNDEAYQAYRRASADYRDSVAPFMEHKVVRNITAGRYDEAPEDMWAELVRSRADTSNKGLYEMMAATDPNSVKNMHVLRVATRPLNQLMSPKETPFTTLSKEMSVMLNPGASAGIGLGARGLGHLNQNKWAKRAYFADPLYTREPKLRPYLDRGTGGALGLIAGPRLRDDYSEE